MCKNHPDDFCYVFGELTLKSQNEWEWDSGNRKATTLENNDLNHCLFLGKKCVKYPFSES